MILTVSITVLQKKTCAKYAVEGAECETSEDPNLECQKGFTCVQYGTNTKKVCVMNYSLEDGTSIASTSSDEEKMKLQYMVWRCLFSTPTKPPCPYSVKPKEYTDYVEEYTKQLAEIVKDEDVKISQLNSQHFNNKELIEKYPDWRFTQIIFNVGLAEDRFYEEPNETLKTLENLNIWKYNFLNS